MIRADYFVCPYCGEEQDTDGETYFLDFDEVKIDFHCRACKKDWVEYFQMEHISTTDEKGNPLEI